MKTRGYALAGAISLLSLILSLVACNGTHYIRTSTPADSPLFESRYGLFRRCDRAVGLGGTWRCRRYPKRQLDCPARPAKHVSTAMSAEGMSDMGKLRFSALLGLRQSNDDLLDLETVRQKRIEVEAEEGDGDRSHFGYCHLWLTSGYVAQLSVAMAACATLCFILVMIPPIASRERKMQGWKLAAGLTAVQAGLQLISTVIIAHLLRTSGRFPDSSGLGDSFALATASWGLGVLLIGGLFWAERAGVARLEDHGYEAIPE